MGCGCGNRPTEENMAEKTIGILGGMGPEATLALFGKIIALTPAAKDQDHLRVVIDSNPKIPDRTAAILRGGDSPLPALKAGMLALQRAGADFAVIPCVSAHHFLEELQRQVALPILSMLEVSAGHIRRRHPDVRKIGLLATSGTLQAGGFAEALVRHGIETVAPEGADQERVMAAIYAVKGDGVGRDRAAIAAEVRGIAARLVARGAQGVVAGCTEIPLVLAPGDLAVPVFDTLLLLARAAIAAAGRTPL
jgi:aspartate racemase